jgi:hypothetical protein
MSAVSSQAPPSLTGPMFDDLMWETYPFRTRSQAERLNPVITIDDSIADPLGRSSLHCNVIEVRSNYVRFQNTPAHLTWSELTPRLGDFVLCQKGGEYQITADVPGRQSEAVHVHSQGDKILIVVDPIRAETRRNSSWGNRSPVGATMRQVDSRHPVPTTNYRHGIDISQLQGWIVDDHGAEAD